MSGKIIYVTHHQILLKVLRDIPLGFEEYFWASTSLPFPLHDNILKLVVKGIMNLKDVAENNLGLALGGPA